MSDDPRRHLPSVDVLSAELDQAYPDALRKDIARRCLAIWRQRLRKKSKLQDVPAEIRAHANRMLAALAADPLPTVLNASGTVLHTGLGRAPLSKRAQRAATRVLNGYCQLEFDLESGKRGNRQDHVAPLLCALTGAEAALVVNNCAAATVLLLQALAQHKEVVVSRGELVEIGGSFRVPEIMRSAGCVLREVGATNKTHAKDYAGAINADTALLLKVHRSNFNQEGFVADVSTEALVEIARAHNLPVAVDQGSGCVFDLSNFDYQTPRVVEELQAGVDVVACSGDKLLGGPQAGILLGTEKIIAQLAKHPLARAMRCDKTTLAALAATLQDYVFGDAQQDVPTLRMLCAQRQAVHARATRLYELLKDHIDCELREVQGAVGSGALPTDGPPSVAVVPHLNNVETAHRQLRMGKPAVVGRIQHNELFIDCATLADDEIPLVAERLRTLSDSD